MDRTSIMNSILQQEETDEKQLTSYTPYAYERSTTRYEKGLSSFSTSHDLLNAAKKNKRSNQESDKYRTCLCSDSLCPSITFKTMVLTAAKKPCGYDGQREEADESQDQCRQTSSNVSPYLMMRFVNDFGTSKSDVTGGTLSQSGSPNPIPIHSVTQSHPEFSDLLDSLNSQNNGDECFLKHGRDPSTLSNFWMEMVSEPENKNNPSYTMFDIHSENEGLNHQNTLTYYHVKNQDTSQDLSCEMSSNSRELKYVDDYPQRMDVFDAMELAWRPPPPPSHHYHCYDHSFSSQEKTEEMYLPDNKEMHRFQDIPSSTMDSLSKCEDHQSIASSSHEQPISSEMDFETCFSNVQYQLSTSFKIQFLAPLHYDTCSTVSSGRNSFQTNSFFMETERETMNTNPLPFSHSTTATAATATRYVPHVSSHNWIPEEHSTSLTSCDTSQSAPFSSFSTKDLQQLVLDDELIQRIDHSIKYHDTAFEYRYVVLPLSHPFLHIATRCPGISETLLSEPEWRILGIRQSRGWEHIGYASHEPNILLFRRPLGTDPRTGRVLYGNEDKFVRHEEMLIQLEKCIDPMRNPSLVKQRSPHSVEGNELSVLYSTVNPFTFYSSKGSSTWTTSRFFFDLLDAHHSPSDEHKNSCESPTTSTEAWENFVKDMDHFLLDLYAPSFVS